MAAHKAKGPEGADKDLTPGDDAALESDPTPDTGQTSGSGQTSGAGPKSGSGATAASGAEAPDAGYIPPAGDEPADFIQQIRDTAVPVGIDDDATADDASEEEVEVDATGIPELAEADQSGDDDESLLSMFKDPDASKDDEQLAQDEKAELAAARAQRKQRPVKKSDELQSEEALVEATVGATTSGATSAKKNRPTRSRAQATVSDAPKKTSLGMFVSQVVQELKKVSWPTSAQLWQYFIVVLVFVLFMIAFIGLLDLLFGWLMLKLFS